jgi:glycosyltransferase involved in cell wall biosynthesis
MKLPISACIITFNEEANIAECIKSLFFAKEIIVLDSGSNDKTCEIAESLGATVSHHHFESHIKQKNHALTYANYDWVIALDADERVSPKLRSEITKLFEEIKIDENGLDNLCDGYKFPRKTYYIDKWISHSGWYPDKHLRLFRKSSAEWGGKNPHDKIILTGTIGELKGDILHYSFSSLRAHIDTINNFSAIMARNLFQEGKTNFIVPKLFLKPIWKFIDMFLLKKGFLDGTHGLIIALFSSFDMCARYAKLYELTKTGFDGKYLDK